MTSEVFTLALEWARHRDTVVQLLFRLMDEGSLVWRHSYDGNGLRYIAIYNDKTLIYRNDQHLLCDGKVIDLGQDVLELLQKRIAIQQCERHKQEQIKNMEELVLALTTKPNNDEDIPC